MNELLKINGYGVIVAPKHSRGRPLRGYRFIRICGTDAEFYDFDSFEPGDRVVRLDEETLKLRIANREELGLDVSEEKSGLACLQNR